MSIRKHFTPDFPDFVRILTEHGFQYLDRYGKAEALVGDSNSNALINKYHLEPVNKEVLNAMSLENRIYFFERLSEALSKNGYPFDLAFSIAAGATIQRMPEFVQRIRETYEKIGINVDAIISPDA